MLCTGCLLNTNTCIPAGNWFVSLHFGVTVQSDRFLGLSTSANALAPFMCAVLLCNILCSGFCFLLPKRKKGTMLACGIHEWKVLECLCL